MECKEIRTEVTKIQEDRINRNIMECKDIYFSGLFEIRLSRINRNIMECKVFTMQSEYSFDFSINRNIMECKVW